jgi:hypothetical protein
VGHDKLGRKRYHPNLKGTKKGSYAKQFDYAESTAEIIWANGETV